MTENFHCASDQGQNSPLPIEIWTSYAKKHAALIHPDPMLF